MRISVNENVVFFFGSMQLLLLLRDTSVGLFNDRMNVRTRAHTHTPQCLCVITSSTECVCVSVSLRRHDVHELKRTHLTGSSIIVCRLY